MSRHRTIRTAPAPSPRPRANVIAIATLRRVRASTNGGGPPRELHPGLGEGRARNRGRQLPGEPRPGSSPPQPSRGVIAGGRDILVAALRVLEALGSLVCFVAYEAVAFPLRMVGRALRLID